MTGLARHGAEISAATVTGSCAQAGARLAPLAEAVTASADVVGNPVAKAAAWCRAEPGDLYAALASAGAADSSRPIR